MKIRVCPPWKWKVGRWNSFCNDLFSGRVQIYNIYIYTPRTQLTLIFEGQPPKTRPFPIKTRVIWVLGIYFFYSMDRNGLVRVLTLSSLNYARFFFGLWTFRKTLNLKDRELMSTGEAEKMKKCKKNCFLWVFPNIMVPPKSSILIGFFIINHPFWGTPIFGNIHLDLGGGFKYVLFSPRTLGKWSILTCAYFSKKGLKPNGLVQPPTRWDFIEKTAATVDLLQQYHLKLFDMLVIHQEPLEQKALYRLEWFHYLTHQSSKYLLRGCKFRGRKLTRGPKGNDWMM